MKGMLSAMVAVVLTKSAPAAPDGSALYRQHCAVCHQAAGQGVPGVFPPLAGSDFLKNERERSLRALLEGLTGDITVNGVNYSGAMPLMVLNDEDVAAVMTWLGANFGNSLPEFTVEEVAKVRAKTRFPTFAGLNAAHGYAPLPAAPPGWSLRELCQLPVQPARIARRPDNGHICVLSSRGEVWSVHPETGAASPLLMPKDYIRWPGGAVCLGICFDRAGRMYLTGNQKDPATKPAEALVSVWRSQPLRDGAPPMMETWMELRYPYGIGGFNHGISHIAEGPDGFLYLSSGSRTDGNEPGKLETHYTGGEVFLTACMWRLDPNAAKPWPVVWCRGLRNPYGFCWDRAGRMWSTDNGPDADKPEELNVLEKNRHYGFPFQFAHTAAEDRPYPYTPPLPADVRVTLPVMNAGPDGGGKAERPIGTFDPHSSPAGIIWLDGDAIPPADRGTLWTVRYGNLLAGKDSGFDLLRVKPRPQAGGGWSTEVTALLAPLSRPIDLLEIAPGRIIIAEFSRGTNFAAGISQNGRLLELKAK
jgi:mono/diheme cytochrome c family protein